AMLIMLVYLFSILVWLLIGNFIAPIFAQKLVTHGGSALQPMTGAMITTTSAVVSGLVDGATRGFGAAPKSGKVAGQSHPRNDGIASQSPGMAAGLGTQEPPGQAGGIAGRGSGLR